MERSGLARGIILDARVNNLSGGRCAVLIGQYKRKVSSFEKPQKYLFNTESMQVMMPALRNMLAPWFVLSCCCLQEVCTAIPYLIGYEGSPPCAPPHDDTSNSRIHSEPHSIHISMSAMKKPILDADFIC